MQPDRALLRMIVHAWSEALRLGYTEAAKQLEVAANLVAQDMKNSPKTILTDEILRVVEQMGKADDGQVDVNS